MSSYRNDWFPTPVWHFNLDNSQDLNISLLSEIREAQKQDPKGEKWSSILGWHSSSNLHQCDRFQEFTKIIDKNVIEVANFLQWDLQKFSLNITTCWAIINGKFASNSIHNHPNSILSGAYYLKAPENCGSIYFTDPRPASQMLVPPIIDFNLWTIPKVSYKTQVGTMLIFPSWLCHGVDINMNQEERIAISFNIGMTPHKQ